MTNEDEFEEALGVYVGEATQAEVIDAIENHPLGEVVVRLTAPDGSVVWEKHGAVDQPVSDSDERCVVVIARPTEQTAGNPLVNVDPPLVLTFGKGGPEDLLTVERYSGGVRLGLRFGPFEDHALTIVFWDSIWHRTESGDIAPGFGGDVSLERRDEEEPKPEEDED